MSDQQQQTRRPILRLNPPPVVSAEPAKPMAPVLDPEGEEARVRAARVAERVRIERRIAILELLQEHAPALFDRARPKPLAIGIDQDVCRLLPLSPKDLHDFMRWWTRQRPYQRALAAGGARYALDGCADGVVTEVQQVVAAERLS